MRSFRSVAYPLICCVCLLVASGALAQEPERPRVTSHALEVQVGGRMQLQFSTSTVDGATPALWEVRRARLELGARLSPLLSARLNPEFSGPQVQLRDAFVQLDFSPAARVVVGQAFRPFGLIAQTSSVRILPIERGGRIRGATVLEHHNLLTGLGYADRDLGVQFRGAPAGAPLRLTYAVGAFNGPVATAAGGTLTYQLVGRITVVPLPDLRLGAGVSRRHFLDRPVHVPDSANPPVVPGAAWQVDLEYGSFAAGPHLMAEAAIGAFDPADPERRRFRAAQLWAAYRMAAAGPHRLQWEPLLRLSHGAVDSSPAQHAAGLAGGLLVTPGINLYLGGPTHRLMLNYDLWNSSGAATTERSLRVMVQAAF